MRFAHKTVIVTGAASGIGLGIAHRFASEGADIAICDIDAGALARVASSFPTERTLALPCDVSKHEAVEAFVAAVVERFGKLDVIVNNAGVAREGSVLEVSIDDWHATLATDLTGVFHGCRAALPELLKTRGAIVNVASVSGLGADWGLAAYNAAKGGVVNLTRSVALDFGARGVRCNSVCPSLTRSKMTEDMLDDAALMDKFRERLPIGRAAEPADIAAVVAFLASDDAAFVNGANLPVDGGVMASNGQPPQA